MEPIMSEKSDAASSPPPKPIMPGFEIALMVKAGLLMAGGVLLPLAVLWAIASSFVNDSYVETLTSINRMQMMLVGVTVLSGLLQVVLVGCVVGVLALLASHKIVGPLVRFEQSVRSLGRGNLRQTISFRRGDQDQHLPLVYRELVARLRGRIEQAGEARRAIADFRRELTKEGGSRPLMEEERVRLATLLLSCVEKLHPSCPFQQGSEVRRHDHG